MPTLYRDLIPDKKLRDKMRERVNNALKRCYDTKCPSYCRYGAKGVTVHFEWIKNKRLFIQYLMTLEGWNNLSLELDRIKVDRGYEPDNLRFVNKVAQARNKIRTLTIWYDRLLYNLPDFYEGFIQGVFDYNYRHVQNLKRYYPNITGEEIIERMMKGIKRNTQYVKRT